MQPIRRLLPHPPFALPKPLSIHDSPPILRFLSFGPGRTDAGSEACSLAVLLPRSENLHPFLRARIGLCAELLGEVARWHATSHFCQITVSLRTLSTLGPLEQFFTWVSQIWPIKITPSDFSLLGYSTGAVCEPSSNHHFACTDFSFQLLKCGGSLSLSLSVTCRLLFRFRLLSYPVSLIFTSCITMEFAVASHSANARRHKSICIQGPG